MERREAERCPGKSNAVKREHVEILSIWKLFGQLFCTSKITSGTPLVAQWLRIRLSMQGTRVRSLVREDATYRGATKSVRHNY